MLKCAYSLKQQDKQMYLIKPKLLEVENEARTSSEALKLVAHIILSLKQQSGCGSIQTNIHNNHIGDI